MLKTFLEDLIKKGRDTKQIVTAYGTYEPKTYESVYSDGKGEYNFIDRSKGSTKGVSNLKSLIAAVKEECQRRGGQTNGLYMTVGFTQKGGYFSCNDNIPSGDYQYHRKLSALWTTITSYLGRELSHADLLIFIQTIKLAFKDIETYAEAYAALKEFKTSVNAVYVSRPIPIEGRAGFYNSMDVNFGNGKKGSLQIPETLSLLTPFAKGTTEKYELPVMLLPIYKGEGSGSVFKLICPELEAIEEKAILDEVELFRSETEELEDLLILEDY